jgi:[protein-PII] uridylyltransferase
VRALTCSPSSLARHLLTPRDCVLGEHTLRRQTGVRGGSKQKPGESQRLIRALLVLVFMSNSVLLSKQVCAEKVDPIHDPSLTGTWTERRDSLRNRLEPLSLQNLSAQEIEAHFSGMPPHYWERVSQADLIWGLQTIHGFLELITLPNVPSTKPFVDWRPIPGTGHVQLMLSTWDRQGLLAKAAAAVSAVHLSILQAEAYTRSDNIVLDVFVIAESGRPGPVSESRLREMMFLLDGALSEPPRFASVWVCSRHKYLAPRGQLHPHIVFDNNSSKTATLLSIEASDRLGLLYDILQTLADYGLDVAQAHVRTSGPLACDVFHVRDIQSGKVLDPARLDRIRSNLVAALTLES